MADNGDPVYLVADLAGRIDYFSGIREVLIIRSLSKQIRKNLGTQPKLSFGKFVGAY